MNQQVVDLFNKLKNEIGDQVKIADVCRVAPEGVGLVRRFGTKVRHGVYDISMAGSVETVGESVARNEGETLPFDSKSELIPAMSNEYVPYGCYSIIRRVVGARLFAPVYITGESGNGKTLGVEQACAIENRELVLINITNETAEEDLIGSMTLLDGNVVWKDGPVLNAMRKGAVLCLDEVDQATPRIMCLQTILQNKPIYVKKTNEIVHPAPGFTVIATANTKGNGEFGDRFAGAQVLNEALLERFDIFFEQEYPPESVETKILKKLGTLTDDKIERLVTFGKISRGAMRDGSLEHCITTRRLVQIARNMRIFNRDIDAINYACSRFSGNTKSSLIDAWKSLTPKNATTPATTEDETPYAF